MGATREDLIHTTIQLLHEGPEHRAVTVDMLAASLRMSKTTLYKYYEGLDDLMYHTVDSLCDAAERDMDNVSFANVTDAFDGMAKVYAEHARRAPAALLGHRLQLPKAAALRVENFEARMGGRLQSVLNQAGIAPVLAYAARAAMEGAVRYLRTVEPERRGEQVLVVANYLKAGLNLSNGSK